MTGDDILVVNFAALAQASTDIDQALATLRRELDQLELDAAPLVHTWDGSARDAYALRQEGWRRAAANLSQVLADIRRAVDDSAADYLSTERHNASLFQ